MPLYLSELVSKKRSVEPLYIAALHDTKAKKGEKILPDQLCLIVGYLKELIEKNITSFKELLSE